MAVFELLDRGLPCIDNSILLVGCMAVGQKVKFQEPIGLYDCMYESICYYIFFRFDGFSYDPNQSQISLTQ